MQVFRKKNIGIMILLDHFYTFPIVQIGKKQNAVLTKTLGFYDSVCLICRHQFFSINVLKDSFSRGTSDYFHPRGVRIVVREKLLSLCKLVIRFALFEVMHNSPFPKNRTLSTLTAL